MPSRLPCWNTACLGSRKAFCRGATRSLIRERLFGFGRAAPNALRVFDVLRHRPVVNIKLVAGRAGVSFATAARMVEALEGLGIVREVTGRARERVFVYGGHLDLLAGGGSGE